MTIARTWIVAAISAVAFASLAQAQDLNPKKRQELMRAEFTGTKWRSSSRSSKINLAKFRATWVTARKYITCSRCNVETSDGKQINLPTGAAAINKRDAPHAGLKILGNTPFKYIAVHIVDKGAPLYDALPNK